MSRVHFKVKIDNYPTAFEALCGIEDYFSLKKYSDKKEKVTCKRCLNKMRVKK